MLRWLLLACLLAAARSYDYEDEHQLCVYYRTPQGHAPRSTEELEHSVSRLVEKLHALPHIGMEVRRNAPCLEVYASTSQLRALKDAGLEFEEVNREERMEFLRKREQTGYLNHDELNKFLEDTAKAYPTIAKTFYIGKSAQNRDIYGIRISDNVNVEEDEPEFKYVANMHGDETVGRVIMVNLIDLLVKNYGQEHAEELTKLVDETDISIVPTMNPDGFAAGRRSNGNFFDLNRNFPDKRFGWQSSPVQPETQGIMTWIANNSFVLSANFHGGAVVANYPYDGNRGKQSGAYEACPDDSLFKQVAAVYANAHTTMKNSGEFPGGITNGAQWYVLYGGMQDWNYVWDKTTPQGGCMELTIELSDVKYPRTSDLPAFWEQNRQALIQYMLEVHKGIRGTVKSQDGKPLHAAVFVRPDEATLARQKLSAAMDSQPVFTDPQVGDFYRLLLPGNYTMTVKCAGYSDKTVAVYVPEKQKAYEQTRYDVQMTSAANRARSWFF